tara:strand:- start:897 stop:1073 length:177 start_codon:yes stop_codon:yes gene_type:complete
MIRSEKYQYNFKPRYNNSEDLKLIQDLEKLQKKLGLKKSELLRMALINLIKYHNEDKK